MIEPYSREQEDCGETDGIVIFLAVICESSVTPQRPPRT
jgi:hypothetical protein